jgi:hypothetical protein
MKKLIITGTALFLLAGFAKAQAPAGLDSILVERYYVSDVNDKTVDATGGVLPLNSVTYRIFVDMKPGYLFKAAYGVDVQPVNVRNAGDHELRIATTKLFFNNEDRGATSPTFSKANATNNTVMLDSWLSVGAACSNNYGIVKASDNGISNVTNADGVLQNNNVYAGIPLTVQDGLIAGTPEVVTTIGITNDIKVFDNQNDGTNGPVFSTYNGSLASLNGSSGPTVENRVLIAQITTNGALSFKLNIQLKNVATGNAENWVADSPVTGEATHPTLTFLDSLGTTGITQINNNANASFAVYPNPATDVVVIDITKASHGYDNSYTVYGVDGKVVLTKKLGSVSDRYQERVDLSTVAPGLYFIEVSLDGAKSTKKVIKN